jgi:hypothetical protein
LINTVAEPPLWHIACSSLQSWHRSVCSTEQVRSDGLADKEARLGVMKVKPKPVPHRKSGAAIVELGPGNENLLFQEWNVDDPAPFRDLFLCADQIQSVLAHLRHAWRAHLRERESDLALNRW